MFAVCLLIYTVWVYTFLCMCAYELCIHLHRLTLTVSLNTCKHHSKSWVGLCACTYATSMCIPPCMLLLVCTSVCSWMCVYVCLSDWLSDASFPPPSVSWPFLPVFVFSRWWDLMPASADRFHQDTAYTEQYGRQTVGKKCPSCHW